MLMGIDDVLALARTPEEREEMKQRLIDLMEMPDEEIDFSDIPRITDFSRFRRGKAHFDAMREHNRRLRLERERKKQEVNRQEDFLKKTLYGRLDAMDYDVKKTEP